MQVCQGLLLVPLLLHCCVCGRCKAPYSSDFMAIAMLLVWTKACMQSHFAMQSGMTRLQLCGKLFTPAVTSSNQKCCRPEDRLSYLWSSQQQCWARCLAAGAH